MNMKYTAKDGPETYAITGVAMDVHKYALPLSFKGRHPDTECGVTSFCYDSTSAEIKPIDALTGKETAQEINYTNDSLINLRYLRTLWMKI